jgi:protease I
MTKNLIPPAACLVCALGLAAGAGRAMAEGGENAKPVLVLVAARDFSFEEFQPVVTGLRNTGLKIAVAASDSLRAQATDDSVVIPDLALRDVDPAAYSGLVVVGGIGSVLYWNDSLVLGLVRSFAEGNRRVLAGIGVGPVLLAKAGVLRGRRATAYADLRAVRFLAEGGAEYVNREIVSDGLIVTASGAAAAGKLVQAVARALTAGH